MDLEDFIILCSKKNHTDADHELIREELEFGDSENLEHVIIEVLSVMAQKNVRAAYELVSALSETLTQPIPRMIEEMLAQTGLGDLLKMMLGSKNENEESGPVPTGDDVSASFNVDFKEQAEGRE